MPSFRDLLLPTLNAACAIPGKMGLRPYTVIVRVRAWDEGFVGRGDATDTDTPIRVGNNQNPKVRRVAYKETVAGGGKYQEGTYRVGPLTPDFAGGGVSFATMAPPTQDGAEIYYRLVGPDTPVTGTWCTAVGEEADHSLHRYLMLQPAGIEL